MKVEGWTDRGIDMFSNGRNQVKYPVFHVEVYTSLRLYVD